MHLVWTLLTKEENNQNRYRLPILTLVNGILYIIVLGIKGISILSISLCLMTTVLIFIAIEDEKTRNIPLMWNGLLVMIGIIICVVDRENIREHLFGMFGISIALAILHIFSKGSAIGGGDVKLMSGAGLILGFDKSVTAFFIACNLALICHLIRMKKVGAEHELAMGPYLALSIWLCAIWSLH